MADSNDELIVKIGADFKQLKAELDKAGNSVKGFSEKGKKSLESIVQKSKELDKDTTFNTLKTELEKAGGDYEKLSKKGIAALRKLNSTTKTSTKKSGDSVAKLDKEVESSTKGVSKSFKDLDKNVEKSAKGFRGSTDGMLGSIKRLRADLGAVKFAVGAATAVVGLYVNRAAESAIETERWAMRLGMSASELSKLSNVAQLGGANLDDLTDTMKEVNIKALEAAEGNEGYRKTFQSLGIDARAFAQLPIEQQFRSFSDAVSTADVGAQQLIRAVDDLASDAGVRMIETLKKGSKGIDEMSNSAMITAASLSDFDFEQIKKAKVQMDRMKTAVSALANVLLVKLAPVMTTVANAAQSMSESLKIDPLEDLNQDLDESRGKIAKYKAALKETQKTKEEFNKTFFGQLDIYKGHEKEISELKHLIELEQSKSKTINEAIEKEIANRERLADLERAQQGPEEKPEGFRLIPQEAFIPKQDPLLKGIIDYESQMEKRPEQGPDIGDGAFIPDDDALTKAFEENERYLEEMEKFREREFDGEKRHRDRLHKLNEMGFQGRLRMATGFMNDIMSMTQNRSKTLFKISKGFAVADALVSTYQGAAKALKLDFPRNLAAMSSVLAAGFSQVNAIKGVSDSGGGGAAAGGAAAATAEAPTQVLETNVTFSGGGDVSQDQFRGFVNGLNDALDDGMSIGRITA